MNDVGDISEDLNLDGLLSNNDIGMSLLSLLRKNEDEEVGEHVDRVQEGNLDPSMFLLTTYCSSKQKFGNHFIDWYMNEKVLLTDTISKMDPTFFRHARNSLKA